MKIRVRHCKELELPIGVKSLVDRINSLTSKLLHSFQSDNYELDRDILNQLDTLNYKFYRVLSKYLTDAEDYDLHGYYLYKFKGERNVLKHPQYKLKFV